MDKLTKRLIEAGVLKTPQIIEAFKFIDRADFAPDNMRDLAYIDEALPIGSGQTISQPYTVVFMLELLKPRTGDKILDVGFGSGWQAAILARIVSRGDLVSAAGRVYAMEIVEDLCKLGKNNIAKYNFTEKGIIEIYCQDASDGLPKIAEEIGGFDRIIAAAALNNESGDTALELLPKAWKNQLKIGGRIVAPIGRSVWLFMKKTGKEFESREYPGFIFVPFK